MNQQTTSQLRPHPPVLDYESRIPRHQLRKPRPRIGPWEAFTLFVVLVLSCIVVAVPLIANDEAPVVAVILAAYAGLGAATHRRRRFRALGMALVLGFFVGQGLDGVGSGGPSCGMISVPLMFAGLVYGGVGLQAVVRRMRLAVLLGKRRRRDWNRLPKH